MSERVVPKEPGWWWVTYRGDDDIAYVFGDESGKLLGVVSGFRAVYVDLESSDVVWLEPVAPLGTAARLAAAETELAALKQRVAEAPMAWVQFGNHNNPCEISDDRETFWAGEHPPGTLRQCRLLEVKDGK